MDCYHRAVNDGVADMPNLLEALLLICIRTAYLSRFAHHSPGGSLRSNCRLIQMPDPKEKEKKKEGNAPDTGNGKAQSYLSFSFDSPSRDSFSAFLSLFLISFPTPQSRPGCWVSILQSH